VTVNPSASSIVAFMFKNSAIQAHKNGDPIREFESIFVARWPCLRKTYY